MVRFPSWDEVKFASEPSSAIKMLSSFLIAGFLLGAGLSSPSPLPVAFEGPISVEAGGAHNIKISYLDVIDGDLSLHYGSCRAAAASDCHHSVGSTFVGNHPAASVHREISFDQRPTRFVWLPPTDAPNEGCLHAFSDGRLVGRSAPIQVRRRKTRRQSIPIADIADAEGPWFDGVAYLKAKEPGETFVCQAKRKSIGIIGGGMSGLMTSVSGIQIRQYACLSDCRIDNPSS